MLESLTSPSHQNWHRTEHEEHLDAFDLLAHRSAAVQQMDEERQQLVAKMQAKFLDLW